VKSRFSFDQPHAKTQAHNFTKNDAQLFGIIGAKIGMNIRVSVLGHIQRGGRPTSFDRVWGSRTGDAAIRFIKQGLTGVFTAMRGGHITPAYLFEATQGVRAVEPEMVQLVRKMGS